jgi:hypothetical protein
VIDTRFSPYLNDLKIMRALAPEVRPSLRLLPSCIGFLAAILLAAAPPAFSQATPSARQPDQPSQPHGKVIFSRSIDENGQTTTTVGPAAPESDGRPIDAPVATDAERRAVTFTGFDMDVHLHPVDHRIAVRARLIVRNDGKFPLAHIPLQISSSLDWERIRLDGRDVPFTVATLNSDVDHTGQLHEVAVPLAAPLAPGATLRLDVTYSGAIPQSAQRLVTIGTPSDVALHSDWDEISVNFTGLRGLGNVVWYPASSVPVILGDGNRVFDEMGEHKLRMAGARFTLRLTVEYPPDQAPTVAFINGNPAPLHVIQPTAGSSEASGFATAQVENTTLGFDAPSLFVSIRTPHPAANTALWSLPGDAPGLPDWSSAAADVTPFLQGWLGQKPRTQLNVLDLPHPDDATFETGSLLVTAIRQAASEQFTGAFVHALSHAWLDSPRAWLSEGVARFMGTLWIEKQSGRQKALEALESSRMALAIDEPSSPGLSAGQTLSNAISPVYYRTKATYVFWMLRDLVGDSTLSAAFRAYDPAADAARGLGPGSGPGTFQKLLEQAVTSTEDQGSSSSLSTAADVGLHPDLSWFFSDWIDSDKGLPDISVDSVFPTTATGPPPPIPHSTIRWRVTDPASGHDLPPPTPAAVSGTGSAVSGPSADSWIVTVNLSNSGYAAAEIPVTVSNSGTSVTQRVLVPARGKVARRILIQGRPTQVQANDGTIPETEASIHVVNLTVAGSSSSAPTDSQR